MNEGRTLKEGRKEGMEEGRKQGNGKLEERKMEERNGTEPKERIETTEITGQTERRMEEQKAEMKKMKVPAKQKR